MTPDERVKAAREKINRILLSLRTLLQLRSVNEIVLYSNTLSKQVGTSYAANAYNVLTGALFESELVRICALWDPTRSEQAACDRDSIPAVAWLIDSDAVADALVADIVFAAQNMKVHWAGKNKPSEDIRRWTQQRRDVEAQEEGARARLRIDEVKKKIAETERSNLQRSLRNFRDKHIAHALVETKAEKKGKVETPRHGHEAELFEASVDIVNDLLYVLTNASFHWAEARKQTARCSGALLSRCKLNILE